MHTHLQSLTDLMHWLTTPAKEPGLQAQMLNVPTLRHGCVQPPHKVNLTSPEKTVIVQLLKSSAALSVAPKHKELMRFNLKELSTTDTEQVKAAHEAKKKDSVGSEATECVKGAAGAPETAAVQAGAKSAEQQTPEEGPSKEGTHPVSDKIVQNTKDTAIEKVPAAEQT